MSRLSRQNTTAHISEHFKINEIESLINQNRHDEILNDPVKKNSLRSYLNYVKILPKIVNKIEYVKLLNTENIYKLLDLQSEYNNEYNIEDDNIFVYCLLRIAKNRKYLRIYAEKYKYIHLDIDKYKRILKKLIIIRKYIYYNVKGILENVSIKNINKPVKIPSEIASIIVSYIGIPDEKIYNRINLLIAILNVMKDLKKITENAPQNQLGALDHENEEKRKKNKYNNLKNKMKNSKKSSSIEMFRTPNESIKELDILIEKIKTI